MDLNDSSIQVDGPLVHFTQKMELWKNLEDYASVVHVHG
jgi:hypothetical protein